MSSIQTNKTTTTIVKTTSVKTTTTTNAKITDSNDAGKPKELFKNKSIIGEVSRRSKPTQTDSIVTGEHSKKPESQEHYKKLESAVHSKKPESPVRYYHPESPEHSKKPETPVRYKKPESPEHSKKPESPEHSKKPVYQLIDFPDEIITRIISYLPTHDIVRTISLVSERMNHLSKDSSAGITEF
jgi:hypothetical protein